MSFLYSVFSFSVPAPVSLFDLGILADGIFASRLSSVVNKVRFSANWSALSENEYKTHSQDFTKISFKN